MTLFLGVDRKNSHSLAIEWFVVYLSLCVTRALSLFFFAGAFKKWKTFRRTMARIIGASAHLRYLLRSAHAPNKKPPFFGKRKEGQKLLLVWTAEKKAFGK